jgi:acyl-coenzyme A thioesterase PaaI-like protein
MSWIPPHHDPACWGCGDNPNGLHLVQPTQEGATEYEAYFSFDERHQGGPGIAHGGLVAGALDEAVGLLATWYAFPAVTARIFVRHRHPVAINTEYLIRARLEEVRGRRLHVNASITDGAEVFAECKAALLHVPLEHFLATPEGRQAGERWARRSEDQLPDSTS